MFFISRESSNFCLCCVKSKQDVRGEEGAWQDIAILQKKKKKGQIPSVTIQPHLEIQKMDLPFWNMDYG